MDNIIIINDIILFHWLFRARAFPLFRILLLFSLQPRHNEKILSKIVNLIYATLREINRNLKFTVAWWYTLHPAYHMAAAIRVRCFVLMNRPASIQSIVRRKLMFHTPPYRLLLLHSHVRTHTLTHVPTSVVRPSSQKLLPPLKMPLPSLKTALPLAYTNVAVSEPSNLILNDF